jgi:hypothetical protein
MYKTVIVINFYLLPFTIPLYLRLERLRMPRTVSYFLPLQKQVMWWDSNLEFFDFQTSIFSSGVSLYTKSQKYTDKSARGGKFRTGAMLSIKF